MKMIIRRIINALKSTEWFLFSSNLSNAIWRSFGKIFDLFGPIAVE